MYYFLSQKDACPVDLYIVIRFLTALLEQCCPSPSVAHRTIEMFLWVLQTVARWDCAITSCPLTLVKVGPFDPEGPLRFRGTRLLRGTPWPRSTLDSTSNPTETEVSVAWCPGTFSRIRRQREEATVKIHTNNKKPPNAKVSMLWAFQKTNVIL